MPQLLDKIVHVDLSVQSKLSSLKIETYWDLLLHIPLRYEDHTKLYPIHQTIIDTSVLIEGEIISNEIIRSRRPQLNITISDGSQSCKLIFFHFYPSYTTQYPPGKRIQAFGEIKIDKYGNKTIIHPKLHSITQLSTLASTFHPIYATTNGLTQQKLLSLIDTALTLIDQLDVLPSGIINNLPSLSQAILTLHKLTPQQFNQNIHIQALQRLKLEELIAQQLLLNNMYRKKQINHAPALLHHGKYTQQLLSTLPFKLTVSQTQVADEIYCDLAKTVPMNRLLQGDVGCGKTIVAVLALLVAVENNYQACLMVPTEILSQQHYLRINQWLTPLGVKVVWLSGSLSIAQKKVIYALIKSAQAQIIIGTHAVFQQDVEFKNLALVVIDEQHRFGVEQRLLLQAKGVAPHQLMMSATPIPRTLAMSYYADLDISTIRELPPGRTIVKTTLINDTRRSEVINFLQHFCNQGSQIYWICPLIEESDKLDVEYALNIYNQLTILFSNMKVGLVHGKLKTAEKTTIMDEFQRGIIQILVATTVIEVGVDVPNASIMVIEHSERMGLSQLHQLRGRVGRGKNLSQCILLYKTPLSKIAKQRLNIIVTTTDGFKVAEADLEIRGPGEILGSRQSGLPILRFADLAIDLNLLITARSAASQITQSYPSIAIQHTTLWFNKYEYYLSS